MYERVNWPTEYNQHTQPPIPSRPKTTRPKHTPPRRSCACRRRAKEQPQKYRPQSTELCYTKNTDKKVRKMTRPDTTTHFLGFITCTQSIYCGLSGITALRHVGQRLRISNHLRMHAPWKAWRQGSTEICSRPTKTWGCGFHTHFRQPRASPNPGFPGVARPGDSQEHRPAAVDQGRQRQRQRRQ